MLDNVIYWVSKILISGEAEGRAGYHILEIPINIHVVKHIVTIYTLCPDPFFQLFLVKIGVILAKKYRPGLLLNVFKFIFKIIMNYH